MQRSAAQAKAAIPKGKLCNTSSSRWQRGRPVSKQQPTQSREHAGIVRERKLTRVAGGERAQSKLGAGGSRVQKQEPRDLSVAKLGQGGEQAFVSGRESLQVPGNELRLAEGGSEENDSTRRRLEG